jgi:hypothetical protein
VREHRRRDRRPSTKKEVAMQHFRPAAVAAFTLAALAGCESTRPTEPGMAGSPGAARAASLPNAPTVIVSGLQYPRGLAFGSDGAIYVAEAGMPQSNSTSTVGLCPQTPPPVGPYVGGFGGRVSRVTMAGERTTVADGLPSARNQLGDVDGVADVAFSDSKLYVLIASGCGRGMTDTPSSVSRIKDNGKLKMEANLSEWIATHPTAHPQPADFEPDGDWYNMAASKKLLYLVEANQGNLVSVRPDNGTVTRVADVSATENAHVVPTGLALVSGSDDLLVGELTPFPAVPGGANVIRYSEHGAVESRLHGFTAILGVVNDAAGNTYVLETFTCATLTPCFPSPGSGDVVRVAPDGTRSVVASGLSFATSLRMGPDGALYVSNFGFGPPAMGQILRIVP